MAMIWPQNPVPLSFIPSPAVNYAAAVKMDTFLRSNEGTKGSYKENKIIGGQKLEVISPNQNSEDFRCGYRAQNKPSPHRNLWMPMPRAGGLPFNPRIAI